MSSLYVSVPNTVRRAEAESWSISDLAVQVYVPSSPSFTLGMDRDSSSFFNLGDRYRKKTVIRVVTALELVFIHIHTKTKETHSWKKSVQISVHMNCLYADRHQSSQHTNHLGPCIYFCGFTFKNSPSTIHWTLLDFKSDNPDVTEDFQLRFKGFDKSAASAVSDIQAF